MDNGSSKKSRRERRAAIVIGLRREEEGRAGAGEMFPLTALTLSIEQFRRLLVVPHGQEARITVMHMETTESGAEIYDAIRLDGRLKRPP
jgi:hypothetical protein